ncbi:MAG: indolepyruvate ferredoxin oxidoreductase subunit alpha [Victivallaceae bacterium]|nr:4Fe-4S binding protein [Victivallaceae bacterium]
MAAKINSESCIGCGACVDSCPVSAIAMDGDKAKINADECIDCGSCVGECPQEAITLG